MLGLHLLFSKKDKDIVVLLPLLWQNWNNFSWAFGLTSKILFGKVSRAINKQKTSVNRVESFHWLHLHQCYPGLCRRHASPGPKLYLLTGKLCICLFIYLFIYFKFIFQLHLTYNIASSLDSQESVFHPHF